MRGRGFVAGLAVAATLTACGDRSAPSPETTGASAGPAAVSAAPSSSPTVPDPSSGAGPSSSAGPSAGPSHGYVPGLVRSTGSDGASTYDVHVPTITGGNAAAAERFTAAMRASLADRVRTLGDAPGRVTVTDGALANGERSRVTRIGARVAAGVLLTNYFMQGAAHPNNQIGTVVIDTGAARPILLTDVLPTQDARARVADMVKQQATAAGAPAPFLSDPERDLANWVPTGDGITFYVPVAHAAGDYRPITLYWFDFRRLRAGIPADVQAVLAS
ncbi:hypothetical protein ACFWXB_04335 [Tsukamurella tyrosinosolvens]|uniref:hypothetical protein n=1 Tax=Tsukamurella tyrosinosolvens TaxID=57704 RepID=UPI001AF99016|nr:hypothetical protein [Tsukamurella tyrosinosolvens]QRY85083.1 hypothetical protein JVY00_02970 [Tsukamurella tyrosinosolvens]